MTLDMPNVRAVLIKRGKVQKLMAFDFALKALNQFHIEFSDSCTHSHRHPLTGEKKDTFRG